ncbi:MAG: hypothetical protein CHACPFDD_03405 [Phycisphaerae bacterium]|nr:hypothetical protein [Phycisphaerae bacterium]
MADCIDFEDWLAKAEGDREGAMLLMREFSKSIAGLIAFLCQQSVEKYLKALLVRQRVSFPRTHDLAALAAGSYPDIARIQPSLARLQPYAVNVRYPGFDPERPECEEAIGHLERVRSHCRELLELGECE